jgi:AcrR family transcriptional regulator
MARSTFTTDELLDATRAVVLARGPRSATIGAIGRQAGAPTGSIYHRFSSIDELLARTWLRSVRRTQEAAILDADPALAPMERAVLQALAFYDFCVARPADVLLLDRLRREDVDSLGIGDALRAEVEHANRKTAALMAAMTTAVFGHAAAPELDLVLLALVDLPQSFVHRYLQAGRQPPASRRQQLPAAVRAVLGAA